MIKLLMSSPEEKKLGANHAPLGLCGLKLEPGMHDDIIVVPEGKFLRLKNGEDKEDGVLFVGRSYYNHSFLTQISGPKILSSDKCGCSPKIQQNGQREWHDHTISGAIKIDTLYGSGGKKDLYKYREAALLLPNAAKASWEAGDGAGADEVTFWAVRLKGDQVAYVQQSSYKGRGGWGVRILKADGTVESVPLDELRGRVRPQKSL